MLEEFDSFLHENYPKELWGIVSFAMITDFLKSFRAKERQDLLALIAEEVENMKEFRGWNGHSTIDTVSVVEANEEVDDIFKSILSLLRSSLQ